MSGKKNWRDRNVNGAGKGDRRRPSAVSEEEFSANWDAIFVDERVDLLGEPDGDADALAIVSKALADISRDIEKALPRPRATKILPLNEPSKLTAFERWWNNPINQPDCDRPGERDWVQDNMRRAFDAGVLVGRQLPKPSILRSNMIHCDHCDKDLLKAAAVLCSVCDAMICIGCEGRCCR